MRKETAFLLTIVVLLFVFCAITGCSSDIAENDIKRIDKEETYPEAPGQLEVKYSSISEIVGDATDIVKVSILEQTVEMLDGYPQTHTTVQVHETYKGDVSVGENLVVIEEGGQDNKVMGGIPQMSKNSNYILFLTEYSGKYYICGAFQGRFIIRDNNVFQQATEDAKLTTYAPAKIDDFVMAVQNDIKTK